MKSALVYFSVRVFSALVGIGAIALYTRLVTPEAYGVFTLILSAVTTVYALGYQWLRAGLMRFLPNENSLISTPAAGAIKGYGWVSFVLILVALILALWPGRPFDLDQLIVGLACTLALSAMELSLAVSQARRRPYVYATLTGCRALGALLVGATLALAGYGAMGLLVGYFVAHALPTIALLIWHRKPLIEMPFKVAKLRPLVDFGWPMAIIGIGGAVIGVSDRYMIAWLVGTAEAGIYAAPYDLAQRSLNMLMLAAFLAYSPTIFRFYDQNDQAALDDALKSQSRLMLLTGLPTALVLALTAPLVAQLMFGQEFRAGAAQLIPWIAAAAVIQGWNSYYLSYGYTLTHKVALNAVVVVISATINLCLNFLWIPTYGALGAAVATLATYGLLFLTSLLLTRRWIALPWPVIDLVKLASLALLAITVFSMLGNNQPLSSSIMWAGLLVIFFAVAMLILNVGGLRAELSRFRRGHKVPLT